MLLSNLSSKNYFLAKAAKTSAKGEIKVFWSNQTSLDFLIFGKIFCHDCGRASFNTSTMNTILFLKQGFGREKGENRAYLCLSSIVFSFESRRL